jgi:hypothetical protein
MNQARAKLSGILAAGAICSVATMTSALAQTIEPDLEVKKKREFYLFDWLPKKVYEYDTERTLRVCNDFRQHDIPLKVLYDGHLASIATGKCRTFEAKTIELSTAKALEDGISMSGTITIMQVTETQAANVRASTD